MFSSTAYIGNEFVLIVINNKANYTAVAIVDKKILIANITFKTMELVCYKEFVSGRFWLDILQAPSLFIKTSNVMRGRYD